MKNSIAKLLFGAWALLAAGMFAACVDDNDEEGTPFIEVSPETLVCSLDGKFEGGGNSFEVKSNRPWTLVAETGSEWIEFAPKQGGEGTTKVEVSVPASNEGRVGTLTFQLANTYAVYLTKQVTVQQGEAPVEGPIAKLVAYIKENLASTSGTVDLNYSEPTVEGVILANNQYGNNFGKLYVGDNVNAPNSAIVLHDTGEFTKDKSANYPVGKKVTLDLSSAKYELFNNLRELKNVKITVSPEEAVEVVVPTLTAAQFNTGNYQGQYVKVTGVTPQAEFVGQAWAADKKRSLKLGADGVEVQTYMATASDAPEFGALRIAAKTGAIWGTAEQHRENIQIIPTKPEDVLELTAGGDEPTVTTGAATAVAATSVTLSGSSRNIDNATEVGIAYKLDNATEEAWTTVPAKAVAAEWSVDVTELTEGTAYMYYAYAKVGDAEPTKGETKKFTTKTISDADISIDFSDVAVYPSGFPTGQGTTELKTYLFDGRYNIALYASNAYYRLTSTGEYEYICLFMGKKGAYLVLPALEGKSLAKVVAKASPNVSTSVEVGISTMDDAAVDGGAIRTWQKGGTCTYELKGTAVNTTYKLYVNNDKNVQISTLDLYYMDGEAVSLSPSTSELTFEPTETTEKTQVYTWTGITDGELSVSIAPEDFFTAEVDADGKTVKVTPKSANDSDSPRTATVTVTLTDKTNASRTATATISVTQASASPQPIADVIAGGTGEKLAIAGQIVGINTSGFIVKDDTGLLFVYLKALTARKVGDNVKVYGETSEYGGLIQLTATESSVTLVSPGDYTQPEPIEMDAAAIDAYLAETGSLSIKYVQFAGTLSISGTNYSVSVPGTSVKSRLQYVPDGVVDASLNGAAVIVTGYAMGGTSSTLNTLAIKVVKDESAPVSTVLAQWSFASADALNATGGNTNSVISRVGVTTSISYTPSSGSIYCSGWDGADKVDKYWLLTIPHSEAIPAAAKLTVAWEAWGTNTSPKSWIVEYSTDNTKWERIATVTYKNSNNDSHSETITVPSEIASGTLYIRFKVDGTTSVNDGTVALGGNSRMANIKISYE